VSRHTSTRSGESARQMWLPGSVATCRPGIRPRPGRWCMRRPPR